MSHLAALVKYNPCNIYATGGKICSYYNYLTGGRKCNKMPSTCELPEYDKWYNDVIDGTMKHFHPRRVRLLETPGTFLVLYNTHRKRILGESTINNATICGKTYYYWFDQFTVYPNPVSLTLIRTDPRLAQLESAGRWKCVYISAETVEEIRSLAGLRGECKERLEREVKFAKSNTTRIEFLLNRYSPFEIAGQGEHASMLSSLGAEQRVLDETERIFQRVMDEKIRGTSHTLFLYAALYLAYRSFGMPKHISEIAKIGELDARRLQLVVKRLTKQLDLELPIISARQWVTRYARDLNLPAKTVKLAEDIAERWSQNILRRRTPMSVAAISLYSACKEIGPKIDDETITKTFNLSVVTFRTLKREYS